MPAPTLATPKPTRLDLEKVTAEERVRWAVENFGAGLVMTTSFGIQAAVMLHLVTRVVPDIPVIFIDTGYLFPETYRFADELVRRLALNLRIYNPAMTAARQEGLDPGDEAQKGRFATAARPHHGDPLARLDDQLDPQLEIGHAFLELHYSQRFRHAHDPLSTSARPPTSP